MIIKILFELHNNFLIVKEFSYYKERCIRFGVKFALRVENFAFADHCLPPVVQNRRFREYSRRIRHHRVHKLYR